MLKTPLKFLITIVLTLGLSMSFQSLLASWTAPTATPPNNNVDEPINAGIDYQEKLGSLGIGNNLIVGNDFLLGGTMTSGIVPWARLSGHPSINVGTGISGGGVLDINRTLSLNTTYTDDRYVNRAGGDTMTGNLSVTGKISMTSTSPTDPLNTVTTKDYVDNKVGSSLEFSSGAFKIYGATGPFSTSNTSFTRVFEVRMHKGGNVVVQYELARGSAARIYVNNSPVGIERITNNWSSQVFSETISNLSEGDRLQIYLRRINYWGCNVSNVKISVSNPDFVQRIVPSQTVSIDGHCTSDSECTYGNTLFRIYDCSGNYEIRCILGHCTDVDGTGCGDDNTDHTPEELQFYREKVRESRDLIEQGKLNKLLN